MIPCPSSSNNESWKTRTRSSLPGETQARLGPELSYLREVSRDPSSLVDRLAAAQVTVVGLGAVGAVAAMALAAAGIGRVRCVDSSAVSAADPYLAQIFESDDVGRSRAATTREKIRGVNRSTSVEVVDDQMQSEAELEASIEGSSFVLGCLDPGLAAMTRKLNRACLAQRIAWSSAIVSAYEGVVGPTVVPYETACFQCYELRAISCTDDPSETVAALRHREERNTDESPHRENLAFGAGIVGQLLALEAFKALIGLTPPTAGRIVTVDFWSLALTHHVVLRKPWCPACFPSAEA